MDSALAAVKELGLRVVLRLYGITPASPRNPPLDLKAAKRILLVRPDEIGDMIMFTPVLRELRRNLPHAHLALLVRKDIRSLVEHCPYIDQIITLPGFMATGPSKEAVPALLDFGRRVLRKECFDVAILTRWDEDLHRAIHLMAVSGAPARVGFEDNLPVVRRRAGLLNYPFSDQQLRHGVDKNLRLLELLGLEVRDRRPELWWDSEDERVAEECLKPAEGKPVLALGVGARHEKRQWPIEDYTRLARHFIERYDGFVLIAGGPSDRKSASSLAEALGDRVLNNECSLSLRQSAAALARCAATVGNDSGAVHIAAAAGTPVIEIACHPMGGNPAHDNAPERFAAYGRPSIVIRPQAEPPCTVSCNAFHTHCIRNVRLDDVQDTLNQLLTYHPKTHPLR